ncbi:MAG: hypothetical protein UT32_C0001G0007 [Parcubacteria group bacterium GW2011_GWC2_39_14]|nr:MAG: hypothetical protein UT32_C0001G0007 [Parcubacteria group bacterium GW2011_GWC2_39_14]
MDIEIDYNPTPSVNYFVSVGLNDKEAISFDNTTKGFRVIKQVLISKEPNTQSSKIKISGEWDTIVLKDAKFVKKYHVIWEDKNEQDVVNGETWETVWEKPISKEINQLILDFSRFVSDNYENLSPYQKEMMRYESIVDREVGKYK